MHSSPYLTSLEIFFFSLKIKGILDTGNKHTDGNYNHMSEKYITPLGSVRSQQHFCKILTTHNKISSQKVRG